MKSLFQFSPPRRADGTLLPAALAVALAGLAAGQFTLGGDIDDTGLAVERDGLAARGAALVPPVPAVVVPPALLRRDFFAASQTSAESDPDAAPPPPLGGAVVAGNARVGGRSYAVVQLTGGGTRRLPIGGMINGWRLARFSENAAVFVRGRQRLEMPFGYRPASDVQYPESETDR